MVGIRDCTMYVLRRSFFLLQDVGLGPLEPITHFGSQELPTKDWTSPGASSLLRLSIKLQSACSTRLDTCADGEMYISSAIQGTLQCHTKLLVFQDS